MSWQIKIAKRVLKQVKKIPKKDAQRLSIILQSMSENPYRGDLDNLKGEENTWRRRVGAYRIIYEIFPKQKMVFIEDIRRRTSTTYRRYRR